MTEEAIAVSSITEENVTDACSDDDDDDDDVDSTRSRWHLFGTGCLQGGNSVPVSGPRLVHDHRGQH